MVYLCITVVQQYITVVVLGAADAWASFACAWEVHVSTCSSATKQVLHNFYVNNNILFSPTQSDEQTHIMYSFGMYACTYI